MFFRPNYCANCGEKIERANWGILTSRRFCQVCESEYKGQDLIPRVIVGLGVFFGLLGMGGYMKSSPEVAGLRASSGQPQRFVEHQNGARQPFGSNVQTGTTKLTPDDGVRDERKGLETPEAVKKETRETVVKTVSSEQTYICGAETKKGTPCSRRVKGNVRCFQHSGMPSMLAPNELRISGKR